MIKTSVVMATYNGAKYIIEQLESIKNQTVPADEVIICDDCSKDNTVEIVEQYIKSNNLKGWHIYINEKNLGYESNFFKALKMADGEYIFFADQDDIWKKSKIEEMVKIMDENEHIKLLCSEFDAFRSSENAVSVSSQEKKMKKDGTLEKICLNSKNIFIGSLGCVMCLRGSFANLIKPYWCEGWAQDEYVWKLAQCVEGCYVYHKPLISRRLHDNNVTMRKIHSIDKRIVFLKKLMKGNEQTYKFIKEQNCNPKYLKLVKKNIVSEKLRIEMLEEGKILNGVKLLRYHNYYHSRKSLLMEPYIAMTQKK